MRITNITKQDFMQYIQHKLPAYTTLYTKRGNIQYTMSTSTSVYLLNEVYAVEIDKCMWVFV